MSVESYLNTLPEGERDEARHALMAHCRDNQGKAGPVYHSVEEYIAAGWLVGRPNGRGLALMHPEADEHTQDLSLGRYGMGYAEFLSPKPAEPKRTPRKRKAK